MTISQHDALIYTMVMMSAVDSRMDERELMRIGTLVQALPVFKSFDTHDLVSVAGACTEKLNDEDGLDTVLGMIAEALPLHLYDTAYALAVEIAAIDLHVEQEELRFLQMLRDRLDLDKLSVAAIEYSARARHRLE
ncbi:MAG: tellurite resistance TerB family protein [Rhizobiales bacterium]|nr:tellurite resistance TerB family protein [Hyphomicrobiales bacterium]